MYNRQYGCVRQGFLEEISRKDDDDDESLTLEEEDDEVEERETNRLRKIRHDYQKQVNCSWRNKQLG